MNDLISRQAMLDGIDKLIKIHFDRTVVLYKARKVAEDLPSAQPETNCSEIPNNSDTISKQAAIESEAISKWKKEFREYVDSLDIARDDWKGIIEYIDELPSAQPDTTIHDSIPAETGKNDGDGTSGDCISRQAVTKFLNDWLSCLFENCHKQSASDLKMIIKDFKNLPSAQPEQRWIPCSERQPDKGDDYLVTLWDDGRTWVEIALWNETFGGRWQAVLYNDVDYSDISNVIAWMPLPEIYQEGDEADE